MKMGGEIFKNLQSEPYYLVPKSKLFVIIFIYFYVENVTFKKKWTAYLKSKR